MMPRGPLPLGRKGPFSKWFSNSSFSVRLKLSHETQFTLMPNSVSLTQLYIKLLKSFPFQHTSSYILVSNSFISQDLVSYEETPGAKKREALESKLHAC